MQAKQSWPPINKKLLYTNLLVYCVIVVVLLVFSKDITWGQKTLNSYLFNKPLLPSADYLLITEAGENLKKKQKVEYSKELLEKAMQIDPYSNAGLLLGICHIAQGNTDKMIETYQQYLSINPSHSGAYIQLINVFSKQQKYDKIDNLLNIGIEHFQQRSNLYEPQIDSQVEQRYNAKASKIHQESLQALKQLTMIKEQIVEQRKIGEINGK